MKKNQWHGVDKHPELHIGQYIVPNFVSNSVAIQVSAHEYVLISPGEPLLAPFQSQFSSDVKLHIVFPNAYHHMGVTSWQQAYPDAKLYASRMAIQQLIKKGFDEKSINPLELTAPPLPEGYDVLFPPGHRAGDIWIRKQHGKNTSWITCDSFLNYKRMSNQPVARFMQKQLGAAPGLKISQVVKWFILNDRQAFKAWALAQLEHDQPSTLIPSHGEIQQDETLATKIKQLIQARL